MSNPLEYQEVEQDKLQEIKELLHKGDSVVEVANAVGLTPRRIYQIAGSHRLPTNKVLSPTQKYKIWLQHYLGYPIPELVLMHRQCYRLVEEIIKEIDNEIDRPSAKATATDAA